MTIQPTHGSAEILDTIIVGGGQAGLALGWHLAQQGRDFVILDAHEQVGDAWRLRWNSLRLFTPAKFNGLPGMPFPGDRLVFPTKDEMADYLAAYAGRFRLPVRTGVRVGRLWRERDRYVVTAGDQRWEATNVVVATGGQQLPRRPAFADQLSSSIVQLHSTAYRGPDQLQPGDVLVVGVGNSGAEIALELSRTHPTLLAGQPSAEMPFRHGRMAARFVLPMVRFVGLYVLNLNTPMGRKVAPKFAATAIPLIRTKTKDLARAGVRSVGRVIDVRDGLPVVEGGKLLEVSNVVWCTGYFEDFSWVDLPVFDGEGRPQHSRGVVESSPGLYFLGLEFLFAAASATLPGMTRDAEYLARHIAANSLQKSDQAPAMAGQGRRSV
jgi:putative flavoprotein involved in K+ transport